MAHKRPISWLQIQNSLPTVERKTKCPTALSLALSLSVCLSLSMCLLEICVNKMAHKKQTYGALPPIVKHFILFHSIWFRSIIPSRTHTHTHISLSLSCHPALWSKRFWVWKLKWNTTEINQLASTFVVACKREKVAGKLSKKVCGKWAFPGRNKNIRKSKQAQRIRHWSITRPTLIASLASRSCSCLYSCSSSCCCFVFYANLNITVR